MAYKQSPGRQMMPKTGRGIPPTLMCGSPMKQMEEDTELTQKGIKSREGAQKSTSTNVKIESQGVDIDPKSGEGSAMSYPKKFIPGDANKGIRAKIIDGTGKLVKEAKVGEDNKLKKEYEKQKAYTMASRNKNARQLNVQTGVSKPNAEEVKAGQNRGFFKRGN